MNPLSILTKLRIWWSYKGLEPTVAMRKAINKHDFPAILYFASKTTVNVSNDHGSTPLHIAAYIGKIEALQTLIELGANIEVANKFDETPLYVAASRGKTETLQTLITLEAKIEVTDASGSTPLHAAASNKKIETLQTLIELGANIEAADIFGETPLHVAAECDRAEAITTLLDKGANIDITDNSGNTPLHLAVMREEHSDSIQSLIELDANIEAINNHGETPLHVAARQGRIDSMLILTARGGNLETINNRGLTSLQQLAHYGRGGLEDFLTQTNLLDTYNVDEIMESVQVAAQDLRAQAQNQESSMQRLSNAEESNLKHIKEHYKQQFTRQGQDSIWDGLKQHLENKYQKNSAQDSNSQSLPLKFDATKEREPYYKHPAHTAWRYLFQTPNPWMAPGAHWVSEHSASINLRDKESIAYLWLAASDENIPPIDDVSLTDRIDFFINALALLGRSHNWDKDDRNEEYDDMEGDKPSCSMGVSKRLAQSIIGHPIAQKDNSEKLTATILQSIFREQVVSEDNSVSNNDNAKWTIHSRLQDLDYKTLVLLKKALKAKVIMQEATTDQESIFQEYLKVPDDAANQFVSYLERKFGQSKIQGNNKKVKFQADVFDNYKALAHHMAQHAGELFCKQILDMMQILIDKKMPDQDMVDNNNNIVTTPQYNLHSRKRKENERGDNNEEIELLEPEKKRSKVNNNNNL